ncbi:two-component system response regulator [Actinoplanes palleronii]|uniref:Two-component system response regulator n=1 Tax=Actinoplanes palleronii TaxID=113570 RepID=A0ABQ4BH27_9ACTN|nr:two-component system response regulator [Actinoplanes palleronii]
MLIVDDDDADTLMIEEALLAAAPPPAVHRVADGSEAMDYLLQRGAYTDATRPDLILLDLNMPRMSGHEVLAAVKSNDALKRIPVVVLTTSTALPDITASYTRHANAFVTKPMDLDGFEEAVQKIKNFYNDVAILPD